ncbi:hypothetical protein [Streptomyces sp. NEAU-H3]|uniref:hypothetical protein n=1 Tax=Streptomyces sp. NEAU-H3 TaxID=2720636 RepID=UPI001438EA2F|nr:hypothetical protein [Streptomyces sp. NEAU-H3]NJA56641.1 hypothetical protein [Streptomyces sp. NEAU-H3]
MSAPEEERAAFAAIQDHATACARCRGGDDECPRAAALYWAWRSARRLSRDEEVGRRAHQHV